MAGSAITAGADGEKEYEECLLKASSMKNVLSGKNTK
jgi:anthranilate/para-aminobenzoate synthase component I